MYSSYDYLVLQRVSITNIDKSIATAVSLEIKQTIYLELLEHLLPAVAPALPALHCFLHPNRVQPSEQH